MNLWEMLLQRVGGMNGFVNMVNQTQNSLQQQGTTAEQEVQKMLNSGNPQAQNAFNYASSIADMLTGRKR